MLQGSRARPSRARKLTTCKAARSKRGCRRTARTARARLGASDILSITGSSICPVSRMLAMSRYAISASAGVDAGRTPDSRWRRPIASPGASHRAASRRDIAIAPQLVDQQRGRLDHPRRVRRRHDSIHVGMGCEVSQFSQDEQLPLGTLVRRESFLLRPCQEVTEPWPAFSGACPRDARLCLRIAEPERQFAGEQRAVSG